MIGAEDQSFSLIFFSFQKKFPSAPCGTSFFSETNGLFLYVPKLDQQKTINLVKGLGKELRFGFCFPLSCLEHLTLHFSLQPSAILLWCSLLSAITWRKTVPWTNDEYENVPNLGDPFSALFPVALQNRWWPVRVCDTRTKIHIGGTKKKETKYLESSCLQISEMTQLSGDSCRPTTLQERRRIHCTTKGKWVHVFL